MEPSCFQTDSKILDSVKIIWDIFVSANVSSHSSESIKELDDRLSVYYCFSGCLIQILHLIQSLVIA